MGLTLTVDGISAAVGDLVEVNPGDAAAAGRGRRRRPRPADLHAAGHPVRRPRRRAGAGHRHAAAGAGRRGAARPRPRRPRPPGRRRPAAGLPRRPSSTWPARRRTRSPRARVDQPLTFGVRALDTLVPCGKGQRLGIFAGSGVGKSSLLAQITRGTDADVRVIGLIGERGREVREFLEENLGAEGMARTVVVVATSDEPPLVRLKAAFVATRIAEAFRDQGRDVLLIMDSITRTAMAQREVGLSAGEPPATRGYPPSVFAMMPQLLEKAGTGVDRLDHRPLHRAGRGRRPQRADRRRRAVDPRRARRADPQAGDGRPLPGHRRPRVDLPRGDAPSCRRSRWPTPARSAGSWARCGTSRSSSRSAPTRPAATRWSTAPGSSRPRSRPSCSSRWVSPPRRRSRGAGCSGS